MQTLSFEMLERRVLVACAEASITDALSERYGAMAAPHDPRLLALGYTVGSQRGAWTLSREGRSSVAVDDADRVVDEFDHDLVVALQEARPELLFVHAAAIEHDGAACLLAGESGHGKSTTTWGLLHHGFRYLSDELSPVELGSLRVLPFPRAISLKRAPPPSYPLPAGANVQRDGAFHLPTQALPAPTAAAGCALGAVIFVRHRPEASAPSLRPIGAAEACAQLYVHALNALAHGDRGLDAVAAIARAVPCFALDAAELRATCELVSATLRGVLRPPDHRA